MAERKYDDGRKTQSNYDYTKRKGWSTEKPSKTIPGQSLTVEELLNRHQSGIPMTYSQHLQYSENMTEPMPAFNDLTDIDEALTLLTDLEEKITVVQANIKKSEQARPESPSGANEPASSKKESE